MKIGFIFECGAQGGDIKVFQHLCHKIYELLSLPFNLKNDFDFEPLDSKPKMVNDCGKAAKRLLASGCDKVFIVWDLYPAWREDKGKPCRHEDKEAIKTSLSLHQLTTQELANIIFLCLEEELEAWLIAGGRALTNYFSKPHRPISINSNKKLDKIKDPKGKLEGHFKEYRGIKYNGTIHAEQIIRNIPDFQKLKKSDTFSRFYEKLSGYKP